MNNNTNKRKRRGSCVELCFPKEPTAMEQTGDSVLSMLPRPQALGEVGHEEDWSWEDIYEALSLYQVLDGGNKEFGHLIGRLQSQRDEEKRRLNNSNKEAATSKNATQRTC